MTLKPRQSTAGVVRERLAEFERRIAFGVRLEALIDELNAEGFKVSYKTFRNALSLARSSRSTAVETGRVAVSSPRLCEPAAPVAQSTAVSAGVPRAVGFVAPMTSDKLKDDLF